MKKVLWIRCNSVDPDPRVEKEINALYRHGGVRVSVLAWDRAEKHKVRKEQLKLADGQADIYRMGIPAGWGTGMKSNIKPAMVFEIKSFFWLLRHTREYDCIHACDLMAGLPALLPVKMLGKKLVYDCCDYYADSQNGPAWILALLRRLETMVIRHADATILCTEDRIHQIAPAVPKKTVYIHNAPDMNAFQQESGTDKLCKTGDTGRMKLVYVGNYCSDRWLLEMLKCAAQMPQQVEVHIGGFGGLEEKINKIAQESSNIYLYGKLPYRQVLQLESDCDVMLALYEPHLRNHVYAAPNKVYEAMALGKPLLMFRGSGMSQLIKQENIGVLIDPNEASFAEGIQQMNELLRDVDAVSGRMHKIFAEKYNWDIMQQRLCQLYSDILG